MAASSVRIWTALPGALLVAGTLYEVFNDLFHPSNSGMLSNLLGRRVFRLFRRWPSMLPAAGPLALVLVIGLWASLLACGFALMYWSDARSIWPDSERSFGGCLFFSMEAMTTLGLGEIRPVSAAFRALASFESIVGLALVTASVSWIVLIYPALARMRTLARLSFLALDDSMLKEFIIGAVRTRIDLIHYPLIYYFAAYDERGSLAAALPRLDGLAEESVALSTALDELAELIASQFLGCADAERSVVFDLYRRDHLIGENVHL